MSAPNPRKGAGQFDRLVGIRLAATELTALDALATARRCSRSTLVRTLLRNALRRVERTAREKGQP